MCNEGTGFVSNNNIGFESFLRVLNGCMCLCHDLCRKE